MSTQPFDYYKNKDVEYDYILNAVVNVGVIDDNITPAIIQLLNNEDLLDMYFEKVSLGRVYGKVEYINNKLHFVFGISLIDATERPTSKEVIKYIKDFILSLNKNVENKELNIKESDIKVDIITENKYSLDNIDKKLVNESIVSFNRNNDVQSLSLTSDGIVERYANGVLCGTMPFSKLGIIRECKSLVADGYTLTWLESGFDKLNEATISTNQDDNSVLDNPEQVKKDLEQNIKDVDEIQNLQNELEDKLDTLNEDIESNNEYVLVVYTNIDGDFVPDVCIKSIRDDSYVVADSVEDAERFSKEDAEKFAEIYNSNKENAERHILKAVALEDLQSLQGLYENKELVTEEVTEDFPSTEFTSKELTRDELYKVDLKKDLSEEQVDWVCKAFETDDLSGITEGIHRFADEVFVFGDSPVISLDKYLVELKNYLPF